MKTLDKILDEINEDEDWYREKDGTIKERRVKLSRILDDSSLLDHPINIRSLNPERVDNIKSKIVNNNGLITTALAMKCGNSFCIIDGNHKQASLKKVCKEVSPDRIKKFGFDKIKIQVLKGDPTTREGAWRGYGISYKVNIDASPVQKMLAIGYGWEHYGKQNKYLSSLMVDFDEKAEVLSRHKQGYMLLLELKELNPEVYDVFMDKYKHENGTIRAINKILTDLVDENKKRVDTVSKPKHDGDALMGTIVNRVKEAEEITDEHISNDSNYYVHEKKLDDIIGFLKETKKQVQNESGAHDINILNNNHYSKLEASTKKLAEGLGKKRNIVAKLATVRNLVYEIITEAVK